MPAFPTPPRHIAAAVLLFVSVFALQGCVSRKSYQNAVAFAAKHSNRQAAPPHKSAFAHMRSVTLLAGKVTKVDRVCESITLTDMSGGQAACISHDGYLLTAAHVVDREATIFTFTAKSESPGTWWKADPLDDNGYLLTNRAGGTRCVSEEEVMVRPIRVVRRFPGTDLALLHAPALRPPAHFKLAEAPPPADSTIWAHCAPSNGPPACVSGKIFGPLKSRCASFFVVPQPGTSTFPAGRGEGSWRILTSAVVQCGDSGSAGFDEQGLLAGVSSTGAITLGIFGPPRSLWSAFDGVSARKIQAAIQEDRDHTRRRITFRAKASAARPSAS